MPEMTGLEVARDIIQQLFPLSKVLTGREATAQNLAGIAQNTGLLHLSAQGRFDPYLPAHSGFPS